MIDLKNQVVLFTAHSQHADRVELFNAHFGSRAIHLALERNRPFKDEVAIEELIRSIPEYSNLFFDSLMHAEAFLALINEQGYAAKKAVQQLLSLAKDKETADYLEANGIPAILASQNAKAIEAIELLIRLKRLHPTIYPSVHGYYEEFPALMHELGAACTEMPVIEFSGPTPEELEEYRRSINATNPSSVFFHAPNAVIRTQTAFPDLDLQQTTNIAKDDRTAAKLKEKNIPYHIMGKGNWHPEDYQMI